MSGTHAGLSVIVPCFNESASVRHLHAEVTRELAHIGGLELLFVDDGSTDDTLTHLRALAETDSRVRYLSLARNSGLEAAQSAGFRYASQPWIAQLDCDMQCPPSEIPRLLATAAEGYDVVFGIREHRQDPTWRRWGSRAQHWLARRIFDIDLPPGVSTFRVVRTAVARTIAELPQGTPYFIATVPRLGLRYAAVAVAHRTRTSGRSRFRVSRLVGHSFELLFGHSWRPLNGTYLVAALGTAAGAALVAAALAGLAGPAVLAGGAVALSSLTLAVLALVGRYLHRLMRDQQPHARYYIREANVPIRPQDRLDGGHDRIAPPATAPADPASGPLLVLGANEGQLQVYREAQRRGIPTIAVDKRDDVPALKYADEHLPVSIRDPAAITAALDGRTPGAVLAAGGEFGVQSWQVLTEHYGTPYRFPASAARASTDKAAFHAAAQAAGVDTYRWRHHTDPVVLAAQAGDVGYPMVVKPADSSGKKGVTLVTEPSQLDAALAHAAEFSFGGGVLLEERLTGQDLTVDVFMRGGTAAFTAVHRKLVDPAVPFRVRGHVTPAPLDQDTLDRLATTAELLCREIGLADGPADFDVFLTEDGQIQVVEVNARLPGEAVPLLIRDVYGVDLVQALVDLAFGEPVELTPRSPRSGILHMLASPLATTGVFRGANGVAAVREMPGVARCEFYLEPGATVPAFPLLGHEVGYLVVTGEEAQDAETYLAAALGNLDVVIDPAPGAAPPVPPQAAAPATEGAPHRVG